MEREGVFVLLAQGLSLLAGRFAGAVGQSVELRGFEQQHVAVIFRKDVVAELHRGHRQLLVDLLEALFARGVEQGARAHETVVGFLQKAALLGIEIERRTPVVDRLHLGEQPLVEADFVGMGRQQGHDLLLERLHLRGVLCGAEHLEDQCRLGEHGARIVVGQDDVLERGLVVVRDDGVDLGVVQRHAALEGGHEVFGADAVERRHAVGGVPLREEGVFPARFRGVARYESHKQTN